MFLRNLPQVKSRSGSGSKVLWPALLVLTLECHVTCSYPSSRHAPQGRTPTHMASRMSHADVVLALVAAGADVMAKDVRGRTGPDNREGE